MINEHAPAPAQAKGKTISEKPEISLVDLAVALSAELDLPAGYASIPSSVASSPARTQTTPSTPAPADIDKADHTDPGVAAALATLGSITVTGIAPIDEATADQITFLTDTSKVNRYRPSLEKTKARAVIAAVAAGPLPLPALRVQDVYLALRQALRLFNPEISAPPGIHPTAFVHETANVNETASIGPLAVIEAEADIGPGAEIGAHGYIGAKALVGAETKLHPRVTILAGCCVGKACIIHSGAVIGSDGFGFHSSASGHAKIPQVGIVEIGDHVEIGANVTIDRAAMGKTTVGSGTKIDNLVHIAHGCKIGRDCIIVAQVGLSGSTTLEDRVTLAGQVGTAGHVTVGQQSTIAARGVVTQDVPPQSLMSGFPLKPHTEEKRIMAALRRLPELVREVRKLQQHLERQQLPDTTSPPPEEE